MAASPAARKLKGHYGTNRIDGYAGGCKERYLNDARNWLKAVNAMLGWEPEESRSFPKGVSVNKGGPAVAGEATGLFWKPGSDYGIYIEVFASGVLGGARASSAGVCIMFRATTRERKFEGLQNRFADWDTSAGDMATMAKKEVAFYDPAPEKTAEKDMKMPDLPPILSPDAWV